MLLSFLFLRYSLANVFMVAHFSSLAYKLTTIPTKVVARRMLPRLMSRFVLAEPSAEMNFLPHLLTPMKGIIFSQVGLFYPGKFILCQERATGRHYNYLTASFLPPICNNLITRANPVLHERSKQTYKKVLLLRLMMIKRLWNDILTIACFKPLYFSDDSETDYQLSGLTPVLPDELFR